MINNNRFKVFAFVSLLCLYLNVSQVSGATWSGVGCVEGKKTGEKWYADKCSICRCDSNNKFTCYNCGILKLTPKPECYVDYQKREANYPLCCEKKYVCKGDTDFDLKKYDYYWKIQIIS